MGIDRVFILLSAVVKAGAGGGGLHQPCEATQPPHALRGPAQPLHQRRLRQPFALQWHLLAPR